MTDTRPCTCALDERPYPCQHKYALGECRKAENRALRVELDRAIAQIADVTRQRLADEYAHGNVMGRIAIALFSDQNNRTDEECVAAVAELSYERSGAIKRAKRAEAKRAEAERDALRESNERLRADAERYRWIRTNPQYLGFEHDFRPEQVDADVERCRVMEAALARGEKP